MVNFTKRDGNLVITADNEERHIIKELQAEDERKEWRHQRGTLGLWYDVTEYWLCNGWESLEDKLALCSNPYLLSDDVVERRGFNFSGVTDNDWANVAYVGTVYAYDRYVFTDPLDELKTKGRVVLTGYPAEPDFLYIVKGYAMETFTPFVACTYEATSIDEALALRDDLEAQRLEVEITPIESDDDYGTNGWQVAA